MSSDKNQSFWILFLSNSEPAIQIFPLVCTVFVYTALLMENFFYKILDNFFISFCDEYFAEILQWTQFH
jgi:hypothetical protein